MSEALKKIWMNREKGVTCRWRAHPPVVLAFIHCWMIPPISTSASARADLPHRLCFSLTSPYFTGVRASCILARYLKIAYCHQPARRWDWSQRLTRGRGRPFHASLVIALTFIECLFCGRHSVIKLIEPNSWGNNSSSCFLWSRQEPVVSGALGPHFSHTQKQLGNELPSAWKGRKWTQDGPYRKLELQ